MYAVIESGGKQHRVELGSEIQVDRLDLQPGDSITLERVLLVADGDNATVGQPVVDGAVVTAEVLTQDRGEKIIVFKYKPKARTRVKNGFRSELTTLRISEIAFDGKSAAKDAKSAESKKAKAAKDAEKAAAKQAAADKELAAKLAAAEAPAKETAEAEPKAKAAPKKKSTAKASAKPADEPAPEAEAEAEAEAAAVAEPQAEAEAGAASDDSEKDE